MTIDLSGLWEFRADPDRAGISEKWFSQKFNDKIHLPGTMEESGYGNMVRHPATHNLNHSFEYSGQAWYSREVECPEGDKIFLFLERVQWESWVFINGQFAGMQNTLVAPHVYDITEFVTHPTFTITIMQDNSNRVDCATSSITKTDDGKDIYGHALSLHLHTANDNEMKIGCGGHMISYSFNGVVGSIKLITKPAVYFDSVHAYPDIESNSVEMRCVLRNVKGVTGTVKLNCECVSPDGIIYKACQAVTLNGDSEQKVNLTCSLGSEKHLWDEFSPELYSYTLSLYGETGNDEHTDRFGMRKLSAKGRHVLINGRRLYMRATLEGSAFPYTGYTPMDEAFWLRAFRILKSYGLNGMRMHEFVPPEAAFRAADEVGFYIQAELPGTSCPATDEDPSVTEYLTEELKNLIEFYGDHPSFMFCSMGNEQLVSGDREFMARHLAILNAKVDLAKSLDDRHFYTGTSHPYYDGRENDDFYLVATKDEIVMNGIRWGGPDPITTSRFCLDAPSTAVNFEEAVLRMDKPVFTHEVGQWAVYPNLKEMYKYTGILKPRNYEIFAKQLDDAGLLGQIDDFVNASGKLSVLLYKEEIESALRTADLSGFELLDIHDYPGQGTSTVGLLDVFFDSKELISKEEFRGFCGPVVVLAEMEKLVWTQNETLSAVISVADYSGNDIPDAGILVGFEYNGKRIEKTLSCSVKDGQLNAAGECQFDLKNVTTPCKCRLTASLGEYENSWDVWVYPEPQETEKGSVIVTDCMTEAVRQELEAGGKVLYIQKMSARPAHAVHGSMTSQFWNPFMKPQETRNGILTDPGLPVFDDFPTDFHTNWNWHDIIMNSWVLEMNEFPKSFFPAVQVVPGIKDNMKLGLIWECRVGKGKLLVCLADLNDVTDRPAAAQLKHSVLRYMNSDSFEPKETLEWELIRDSLSLQ